MISWRMRACLVLVAVVAVACSDSTSSDDLAIRDLGVRDFRVVDDLFGRDLAVPDLAHPDLARIVPDGGFHAPTLALAAPGVGGGLATADFEPSSGWSNYTVDSTVTITDVSVSQASTTLVAMRLSDGHLNVSTWDRLAGSYTAPKEPFATAFTAHRPALGGAELLFQGGLSADKRLYDTHWDGTQFGAAAQQASFLTDLAPVVLTPSGSVHAVFTGTDKKIYDGTVGAAAVEAGGGTSNASPAATVLSSGVILVVFAGEDTNLYWSGLSGGNYTAPKSLCAGLTGCLVDSDLAPLVATTGNGAVVVWRGKDKKVYSTALVPNATFASSSFAAAIPASGTEMTNFSPALASGVTGADAELVWARDSDGAGRHARLISGAWSTPTTIPSSNLTGAPALAR